MVNTRLVVLGTGTEVGKTEVSCAVLRAACRLGVAAVGLKPVMTGDDSADDATRLGVACGHRVEPLFQFKPPVSPHLASRMAGVEISIEQVAHWVTREARDLTVIETAGGVLSPLSRADTNLDLALALQPARLLLVASARLGVLHDVAAAILSVRFLAPDVEWAAVVISSLVPAAAAAAATEVRDVVLPRVGCTAPVLFLGPAETLDPEAATSFLNACLPSFHVKR